LRWGDVDLDRGVLRVLGKDQHREPALLPGPAREGLDRWQRVQRPADDDWPVFPTDHAPSKYRVGRTELGETFEERLDAVDGDIDALLREHSLAPPALTTEGARSLMRRLTDDAGVEVGDDAGYLQLHGARRGILEEIYRRDRGDAQDLARHKSLSTTRAAYQHIDAEEKTRRIDDHLGEIE
jgi:integrase